MSSRPAPKIEVPVLDSGSNANATEKPPNTSTSPPAAWTAANRIAVMKPSAAPITICSAATTMIPGPLRSGAEAASCGITGSASMIDRSPLTVAGMERVLNGGEVTSHAAARSDPRASATRLSVGSANSTRLRPC